VGRVVVEPAYPLWTVHIADLKTAGRVQSCARCGEAVFGQDTDAAWPRGRLVAVRGADARQLEIRLIDDRDNLLDDERPCGED
jgi:hypothetical protein